MKKLVEQAMELMMPKESEGSARKRFCHHKRDVRRIPRFVQEALAMEPEYYQLHFQVAIVNHVSEKYE